VSRGYPIWRQPRELGVGPEEQFARSVTNEVLRAADVIVTMGHSVGVVDIPHQQADVVHVGEPARLDQP
jgi:protein-tyrosine-phosphatase